MNNNNNETMAEEEERFFAAFIHSFSEYNNNPLSLPMHAIHYISANATVTVSIEEGGRSTWTSIG